MSSETSSVQWCSELSSLRQSTSRAGVIHTDTNMSDRDRASTASPSLMEAGLKTLIGGRDSNYPLISGINGE